MCLANDCGKDQQVSECLFFSYGGCFYKGSSELREEQVRKSLCRNLGELPALEQKGLKWERKLSAQFLYCGALCGTAAAAAV